MNKALALLIASTFSLTSLLAFADDRTSSSMRNMGINKSAEASKAGPTPQRDYINTPDAEAKMYKQKGQ